VFGGTKANGPRRVPVSTRPVKIVMAVPNVPLAGLVRRGVVGLVGLAILVTLASCGARLPTQSDAGRGRAFEVQRRFTSADARQGPAVDGEHFYAINNRAIAKYDKRSGELVARWDGTDDGEIVHLNSGVVIGGRLHAAHSNYPDLPMVSSIETFDLASLDRVGSHRFGTFEGSATWVDRRDGQWWVVFANYEGRGGQPGKGPADTVLVSFDDRWNVTGRYTFPAEVVRRFGTRSNSGGAWGPDGLLYATGHDAPELYVLRLPAAGTVLELVEVVAVEAAGQGVAWDRGAPGTLYTIVKRDRQVVVSRMRGAAPAVPARVD